MVEPASPSTPAVLAGAGLRIARDPREDGHESYVISGNTYHHKETLKAHGGRRSKSHGAWIFDDASMIERLCDVFGDNGTAARAPGFAEAPVCFDAPPEPQKKSTQAASGPAVPHLSWA